ncbi:MAG TPA: 4-hydroxythreonine-4-phosphate dehydrogenase PdxA, partial [Pirellulales bacterium]
MPNAFDSCDLELDRPLIAVTLGDPCGIGPEAIVAAWRRPEPHALCRPFVVGRPEWVRRAADSLGVRVSVVAIRDPEEADPAPDVIPCLVSGSDESLDAKIRGVDARGGQAAYDALVLAAQLALAGRIDALTTAPLCKESLHAAGKMYPGHTELLGELCGAPDVAMMLYLGPSELVRGSGGLGVAHATLHTAMRNIWNELTEERILATARLCTEVMERMKGETPKIGVAALNCHAGENGLFGDEEQTLIRPAVEKGIAQGLPLSGPHSVDSLFAHARDGKYDGVVAMYHDQGHIA